MSIFFWDYLRDFQLLQVFGMRYQREWLSGEAVSHQQRHKPTECLFSFLTAESREPKAITHFPSNGKADPQSPYFNPPSR